MRKEWSITGVMVIETFLAYWTDASWEKFRHLSAVGQQGQPDFLIFIFANLLFIGLMYWTVQQALQIRPVRPAAALWLAWGLLLLLYAPQRPQSTDAILLLGPQFTYQTFTAAVWQLAGISGLVKHGVRLR
jgi:hypothetical protein